MYAFPHVCSESQFLGGQDFDPLQEISQVDGGRLRQFCVLAVVKNVLEADEQRVILIKRKRFVVVYAMDDLDEYSASWILWHYWGKRIAFVLLSGDFVDLIKFL